MQRYLICLAVGLLAAFVGPRVVGPQSHAAGAPFAYEPPEGFGPVTNTKSEAEGAKAWSYRPQNAAEADAAATRVVVHHSAREMSVEETDLAKLTTEMKKAFEGQCVWTHRRHELRTRSDGARVGLIEGDCSQEIDLAPLGLPTQAVKTRRLQLLFPDDTGTSIATISYPTDQAARWEPVFEATINKAHGVATRIPPPAPWVFAAWGAAGLVVGWLLAALVFRKSETPSPEKSDTKTAKKSDDA